MLWGKYSRMGKWLPSPEVSRKGIQCHMDSGRVRRPEVKKYISMAAASSLVGKPQATDILPFTGNFQLGQSCCTTAKPEIPVLYAGLRFSLQNLTFFPLTPFLSFPSSQISSFQTALVG